MKPGTVSISVMSRSKPTTEPVAARGRGRHGASVRRPPGPGDGLRIDWRPKRLTRWAARVTMGTRRTGATDAAAQPIGHRAPSPPAPRSRAGLRRASVLAALATVAAGLAPRSLAAAAIAPTTGSRPSSSSP